MPKKSSNKKGGAFAYVKQFDYPLSPCYKPQNKAPIPKLGWHAGGASCDSQPTVAKMGIIDTPLDKMPTASEVAWNNRYTDPKKSPNMQGGAKQKILQKLNKELNSNKQSNAFSIEAQKGGKEKLINVVNLGNDFVLSITDKNSNKSQYMQTSSADKVQKKIQQFNLLKFNKSKKL